MAYLKGGCVLKEGLSYRKTGFNDGIPYRRAYHTGGHLNAMYNASTCLMESHGLMKM